MMTRRTVGLMVQLRLSSAARVGRYWIGVAPAGAPFWVTATAAVDW